MMVRDASELVALLTTRPPWSTGQAYDAAVGLGFGVAGLRVGVRVTVWVGVGLLVAVAVGVAVLVSVGVGVSVSGTGVVVGVSVGGTGVSVGGMTVAVAGATAIAWTVDAGVGEPHAVRVNGAKKSAKSRMGRMCRFMKCLQFLIAVFRHFNRPGPPLQVRVPPRTAI
jgi:hypothetical protein